MSQCHLGQYEEVPEGGDDPAGRDEDGDEANEVVPARGARSPGPPGEGGDGHDEPTGNKKKGRNEMKYSVSSDLSPSSHLFDAEGHQDGVAELGEEDEEKHHEPHARVGFECFVRGAEPTEERGRNEEDDVSQGQTEGAPVIQTAEEIAESSEEIGEI